MKITYFKSLCLILVSSSFFFSCDKNTDVNNDSSVRNKFISETYPGAEGIEWTKRNGREVATFTYKGDIISTWFDGDDLQMTEKDITYTSLPTAVKTTFETSKYNKIPWQRDEVEEISRVDMETVYIIEVESNIAKAEQEVELYYSTEGILIREKFDNDDDNSSFLPAVIPTSIQQYIDTNYSGAIIMEFDVETDPTDSDFGTTEVDIIHKGISIDLIFDKDNNWISSEADDLTYDNLPEAVKITLTEKYLSKGWVIDDIEFFETARERYYIIELEKANNDDDEIIVQITPEGVDVSITLDND